MYEKVLSKKQAYIVLLILITIIAFIMRLRYCFWGYPLRLNPDEGATVTNAIDLLSRHSWEAHAYFWPNHFDMKCNAYIFALVSRIRYHVPAYDAITDHELFFFLIARSYTTMFGTALVPLIMTFVGRIAKEFNIVCRHLSQIFAGLFVAFSTVFIQHSAIATPDIGLTFWIILFAYNLLIYAEDGQNRSLYLCSLITGVGITYKYSAAILIIPLAMVVIYKTTVLDKNPLMIVRYALACAGIVTFTVFVIAPNIFTDFHTVYEVIKYNARSTHLGADGLGFFGNLWFYLAQIMSNLGYITIIPFLFGLIFTLKYHNCRLLSLSTGLIYWICISVLGLHWTRWGIPVYSFYIIVVSLGMGYIIQCLRPLISEQRTANCVCYIVSAVLMLILFNMIITGFSIVKFCSLPDTRVSGLALLDDHGITEQNTLIEGYTPLAPYTADQQINSFIISSGVATPIAEYADKEFFMKSDNFSDRYRKEPDRYKSQIEAYDAIDNTYDKVIQVIPDGNYEPNGELIKNIKDSILYLAQKKHSTGCTITVYDLRTSKTD